MNLASALEPASRIDDAAAGTATRSPYISARAAWSPPAATRCSHASNAQRRWLSVRLLAWSGWEHGPAARG
jgi:purine nucleoside permease